MKFVSCQFERKIAAGDLHYLLFAKLNLSKCGKWTFWYRNPLAKFEVDRAILFLPNLTLSVTYSLFKIV